MRVREARDRYLEENGFSPYQYDALLALSLGELRERLGIPRDGLADRPSSLHARAPRQA
jgi:hypothetical protein